MTLDITPEQHSLIIRSLLNRRDMMDTMAEIYIKERDMEKAKYCIKERQDAIDLFNTIKAI